jgi:hypothetical protein
MMTRDKVIRIRGKSLVGIGIFYKVSWGAEIIVVLQILNH